MTAKKKPKVNFALCWHMHQPWYQEGIDGDYRLPWVYLHAIKDYSDMVAHLEAHPGMKCTVNFAPVLLEQLTDYGERLNEFLKHGSRMNDPLLNLLAGVDTVPAQLEARNKLIDDCQRANAEKMIDPYPVYRDLLKPILDLKQHATDQQVTDVFVQYLGDQYFIDLLVWYHLAWLGHSLKQTKVAQRLINKGTGFDHADRRDLIQLMQECIAGLVPRYRKLAEAGQIEISMTPYGHPIIPLLNDIDNMACAQPDAPRPDVDNYPGGQIRSRWHMAKGIESFQRHFGFRPEGVWLSEGAVSDDAVALADEYDFKWTASGQSVWHNSLRLSTKPGKTIDKCELFHAYELEGHDTRLFFRDDGMSDLVGFEYSKRNSDEAAEELVSHLVNIADELGDKAGEHVVSVILDGENAWEYYPHNGHYFLDHLYALLEKHPRVQPVRYSDVLKLPRCRKLKQLCAGSWVYGSFSTWIGDPDKNRAWELLVQAKLDFDDVVKSGKLDDDTLKQATRQLAIAEGSDWFWWFGDYNPGNSVSDFDQLFRIQLRNLYDLMGLPAPDTLDTPVSVGGGDTAANAGTMVRNV